MAGPLSTPMPRASGSSPGDTVVVQVNRDGKVLDVTVTLGTLK